MGGDDGQTVLNFAGTGTTKFSGGLLRGVNSYYWPLTMVIIGWIVSRSELRFGADWHHNILGWIVWRKRWVVTDRLFWIQEKLLYGIVHSDLAGICPKYFLVDYFGWWTDCFDVQMVKSDFASFCPSSQHHKFGCRLNKTPHPVEKNSRCHNIFVTCLTKIYCFVFSFSWISSGGEWCDNYFLLQCDNFENICLSITTKSAASKTIHPKIIVPSLQIWEIIVCSSSQIWLLLMRTTAGR